jgi:GntR family transcriptional regulator
MSTLSSIKSTFDPDSFTPLYIQVAQILREAINEGVFKQGDRLPSEKELVDEFGISRMTAKTALDELVKSYLAYRERGRGTFVAKPLIRDFSFFSSFTEDMRARGLKPSSRLVSLEIAQPDEVTLEKLKMPVETEYYCLARVRLVNDEPVAFQRAYLPTELYPQLDQHNFEADYLFDVIRRTYGFKPTWAEAIVEAGVASPEDAVHLEVETNAPILIVWHLTLDERFSLLEYVYSVYRSDRFSFATGRNPIQTFR